MTNDRELSDLKLERKECPKCGAVWINGEHIWSGTCLLYTSPSPRDATLSRMPSSA